MIYECYKKNFVRARRACEECQKGIIAAKCLMNQISYMYYFFYFALLFCFGIYFDISFLSCQHQECQPWWTSWKEIDKYLRVFYQKCMKYFYRLFCAAAQPIPVAARLINIINIWKLINATTVIIDYYVKLTIQFSQQHVY